MHATIHIGTPKTGSTSVQSFLFDNYDLLSEQGCLYPRCLCHPVMARTQRLADQNRLTMHLAYEWPMDLHTPLRAELASSGCHHLLLSSEMLSGHLTTTEQVLGLKRFLDALGCSRCTIALWLREPGALFTSACSQGLKAGHPEYRHRLTPHNSPFFRNILDNRALLQRWAEVFGREALVVRLFERECFVQGDLLHDAIDAFGLEWDERFAPPPRVNETLNLLEMEVLRVVNHLQDGSVGVPGSPKYRLFEVLHHHAGALDGPQLRFAPPQQIVQAWREWAAEGNEWVREEFFPDRPTLFAPPRAQEENFELTHLTPGCWEALGRVMAELSEENVRLRVQLQQLRAGS